MKTLTRFHGKSHATPIHSTFLPKSISCFLLHPLCNPPLFQFLSHSYGSHWLIINWYVGKYVSKHTHDSPRRARWRYRSGSSLNFSTFRAIVILSAPTSVVLGWFNSGGVLMSYFRIFNFLKNNFYSIYVLTSPIAYCIFLIIYEGIKVLIKILYSM